MSYLEAEFDRNALRDPSSIPKDRLHAEADALVQTAKTTLRKVSVAMT